MTGGVPEGGGVPEAGGVIGTAGHIDHGKTALVAALSGIDTDRLPEEQRRGISIDLGFSHLRMGATVLGIVDVPGHEDFIRNMVAGATGIDLLLLVVAADEGVMPQTREHVAIAGLLGVPRAVVALTKTDLVEEEWLELAADDASTFLATTPFAGAPVLPVSAVTGCGLDGLRAALLESATGDSSRHDDLFRLPVDRCFTVRGTGTVVTGTVWSGALERDRQVRLLPGALEARVRALQVHGEDVERVSAGQRAAVALAGVDRDAVERGVTLVADDAWTASSMLTVRLRAIPDTGWGVEQRQRVRVHLGTAEVMGRVALLEGERVNEGEEAWAQLRLESPLVARAGDRLVVRSYSPVTTIGGGVVVEPRPPKRGSAAPDVVQLLDTLLTADPGDRVQRLLEHAALRGVRTRGLPVDAGLAPVRVDEALSGAGAVVAGERAFAPAVVESLRGALVDAVRRHHRSRPIQPGIDPAELRRVAPVRTDAALLDRALEDLLDSDELVMREGRVAIAGHEPTLTPAQAELRTAVLETLGRERTSPPRVDDLRERLGSPPELMDLLEYMQVEGRLTRVDVDLFLERAEVERMATEVRQQLGGRNGLTPADFRDVIPLSRRHLIPILEHLDRLGVTVRSGEGRAVPAGE